MASTVPGPEELLGFECGLTAAHRGLASAGHQSRPVFCTVDNEVSPDHMCQGWPRPADRRPCSLHPCPQTKR